REYLADALGEFGLHDVRRAVGQPVARRAGDRLDDFRVRLADDHRTPGPEVVDVAAALDVPHVGALGAGDESRRAADRAKSAHGGVHTADQDALRALEFRSVGA